MLDGLDLILRWYLDDVRPGLGDGPALFCEEGGGRIHRGTIRTRLAHLLDLERGVTGDEVVSGNCRRAVSETLTSLEGACDAD
jgi:integrase/recombinase XerD